MNTDCRNRIDLAVNAGACSPVVHEDDRTDLYIEGHSAILGGPVFGDTQVKLAFADGALQCENGGAQVTLQLQQDAFLRLTVTGADVSPQTFYLLRAATAPDEAP